MAESVVMLGNEALPVWPAGQTIETLGHPTVMATRFADTALYHPRLIAHILAEATRPRAGTNYFRGAGGTKLHHVDRWHNSEAQLLHARALELYRRALARPAAVADLCWANVYRGGEYCMPHSHMRATASIVYFVDNGDADPEDPLGGRFFFADPRLPACCGQEADKMTSPQFPESTPGTMLIFPSQLIHSVNPYHGTRARITISWNVNDAALPGVSLADAPKTPT